MRFQLARFRIDDLKLFLDTECKLIEHNLSQFEFGFQEFFVARVEILKPDTDTMSRSRVDDHAVKIHGSGADVDRHQYRRTLIQYRSRCHIKAARTDITRIRDTRPIAALKSYVNNQLLTICASPLRWRKDFILFFYCHYF